MNTNCLDESHVLAFIDGTVSDDDRVRIESHLVSCSACSELVTHAAADHADRGRGLATRPFIGRLAPGSRVARYQILGFVGRGGMGEVYAAYHPDLDRRIALKIGHDYGVGIEERQARLLREARSIARLSHPNVVPVYDAGTAADRVYVAMEFIEGPTLDRRLRGSALI